MKSRKEKKAMVQLLPNKKDLFLHCLLHCSAWKIPCRVFFTLINSVFHLFVISNLSSLFQKKELWQHRFFFFLLESKAEAHIHELYRNPRKKPKICSTFVVLEYICLETAGKKTENKLRCGFRFFSEDQKPRNQLVPSNNTH